MVLNLNLRNFILIRGDCNLGLPVRKVKRFAEDQQADVVSGRCGLVVFVDDDARNCSKLKHLKTKSFKHLPEDADSRNTSGMIFFIRVR